MPCAYESRPEVELTKRVCVCLHRSPDTIVGAENVRSHRFCGTFANVCWTKRSSTRSTMHIHMVEIAQPCCVLDDRPRRVANTPFRKGSRQVGVICCSFHRARSTGLARRPDHNWAWTDPHGFADQAV